MLPSILTSHFPLSCWVVLTCLSVLTQADTPVYLRSKYAQPVTSTCLRWVAAAMGEVPKFAVVGSTEILAGKYTLLISSSLFLSYLKRKKKKNKMMGIILHKSIWNTDFALQCPQCHFKFEALSIFISHFWGWDLIWRLSIMHGKVSKQ